MMKIGLVIEHFAPQRGGAEQWTYQLVERLLALGHEVHVVSQDASGAAEQLPVTAHLLGQTSSRLGFAEAAERKLRSLTLDVVHDMGAGWYGEIFQSHEGSRFAQWQQKLLLLPPWLRPLKRKLIAWLPRYREFRALQLRQFADPERLIVAISKRVARDYQLYHGVRPSQIRLVYHGVDTARFSPARCATHRQFMRRTLGFSKDEIVLLFLAHNFALKGLATLIQAVGRLGGTRGPFRAAVVGRGRPGPYVRLAQRCGAGSAVRFLGAAADPLPYYAAADICVQPTFYDSFGLTVLEAAACGLPAITSQTAGVSELLSDGIDGCILVDPADDAALAERLRTLSDPAMRRAMGNAARQLAQKYTFDRNCEEIIALYGEIAGRVTVSARRGPRP